MILPRRVARLAQVGLGVHAASVGQASPSVGVPASTSYSRDSPTVDAAAALGTSDNLLVAALDLTDPATIDAAVQTALKRFGRIDILVNSAANFYAGFFEELSPRQSRDQIETSLMGLRPPCA